jgi:hypothetical protein
MATTRFVLLVQHVTRKTYIPADRKHAAGVHGARNAPQSLRMTYSVRASGSDPDTGSRLVQA